ncbi:hypothetical protein R3P38DRAFT_3246483 [Favolaschia claudopus]|uniref:Uncharacterized protein n=1 Tax=Favolaschia claudopus TaxID=2862362 RepID=A0AAV9YYS2_9AGAR
MLVYAQAETMPVRFQVPLISLPETELNGNNRVRVSKANPTSFQSRLILCCASMESGFLRTLSFLPGTLPESQKEPLFPLVNKAFRNLDATRLSNEARSPKSIAWNLTPNKKYGGELKCCFKYNAIRNLERKLSRRMSATQYPVEALNGFVLNLRTKQSVVVWSHSHALCFSPPTTLTPTLSRPVPPPQPPPLSPHPLPLVAPPPFAHSTRRTVPPRVTSAPLTTKYLIGAVSTPQRSPLPLSLLPPFRSLTTQLTL